MAWNATGAIYQRPAPTDVNYNITYTWVGSALKNQLPQQARGYYTEWTVDTPGAQNRAKRRVVAGAQGEQYYTDDHYLTFTQIRAASPPPPTKQ